MALLEDLERVLANFPGIKQKEAEFVRLQEFLAEMKAAGIAKTREYDLPQPDTIGRSASSAASRRYPH